VVRKEKSTRGEKREAWGAHIRTTPLRVCVGVTRSGDPEREEPLETRRAVVFARFSRRGHGKLPPPGSRKKEIALIPSKPKTHKTNTWLRREGGGERVQPR